MKLHEGLHVATFQDGRTEICAGMETMLSFPNHPRKRTRLVQTLAKGISRSDYFQFAKNLGVGRTEAQEILTQLHRAELLTIREPRLDAGPEESLWKRIGGNAMQETYRQRSRLKVSLNRDTFLTRLLGAELARAGIGTLRVSAEDGSMNHADESRESMAFKSLIQGLGFGTSVTPPRGKVDLAVQLSWGFPDPLVAASAMRRNIAHLPVVAGNDYIEIGPLVVPGLTPCVACVSNHRREFYPDMLEHAVSLLEVEFPRLETSLATAGAALAGSMALAFLDHRAIASGQVTRVDVDGGIEVMTYDTHPDCACCELPMDIEVPEEPRFSRRKVS